MTKGTPLWTFETTPGGRAKLAQPVKLAQLAKPAKPAQLAKPAGFQDRRGLSSRLVRYPFLAVAAALWLAALSPTGAWAGCLAEESAALAMDDSRIRYESRQSFPSSVDLASAWGECLSALSSLNVVVLPDLGPLPDFRDLTERLCRETRRLVLEKAPLLAPVFSGIRGGGTMSSADMLADELTRALE